MKTIVDPTLQHTGTIVVVENNSTEDNDDWDVSIDTQELKVQYNSPIVTPSHPTIVTQPSPPTPVVPVKLKQEECAMDLYNEHLEMLKQRLPNEALALWCMEYLDDQYFAYGCSMDRKTRTLPELLQHTLSLAYSMRRPHRFNATTGYWHLAADARAQEEVVQFSITLVDKASGDTLQRWEFHDGHFYATSALRMAYHHAMITSHPIYLSWLDSWCYKLSEDSDVPFYECDQEGHIVQDRGVHLGQLCAVCRTCVPWKDQEQYYTKPYQGPPVVRRFLTEALEDLDYEQLRVRNDIIQ